MAAQKEPEVQDAKKQIIEAADNAKGNLQQLLGIRGASESTNIWKIRLQLTKPVTWVPLIWGESLTPGTKSPLVPCTLLLAYISVCSV